MKLIVNAHKIEIEKEPVNEKEIDITKCEFEFIDEITNEFVKEAYFTLNGVSYKQIIVNNECAIPYEVLQEKGQVEIGVVAYKVENEEEIKRYNPSSVFISTWAGSLKDNAENSEPITPSEMEQFEQQLQNGLNDIQDKIDEVDDKLSTVDSKIDEIDTAIEETNNLDIDIDKENKETTITLTKKDGTTKTESVLDGKDLQFVWRGTELGVKTSDMEDYVYTDLQGVQGETGQMGEPFTIKKTYSSVAEMNADFDNMQLGDYVMIASTVEVEDNAKLYTRGETQWIFITDFSGATGIRGETGLTPNIQIGTVTSGATPSVTRSGTNENPILNFVLQKGDKGDKPIKGVDYFTQSDIDSMVAQVTEDATSEFNQNVTAKTNEFNTNATNKTTDFNNNATAKTTAFNDNATQKTNEFNTNAQNKTDEFNANKEALQEELDYYKTTLNALPKVEGTGTSLTLNNTANAPMKMIPMTSELEQATTTGKNLLPYTSDFTETKNGCKFEGNKGIYTVTGVPSQNTTFTNYNLVANYTIQSGDYLHFFNDITIDGYIILGFSDGTYSYPSLNVATNRIFDLSSNVGKTITKISIGVNTGNTFTKLTFKPMIINSSTATDWEQFTFGASPNPQYPQQIHTISGDNEIIIRNKNLIKFSNASGTLHDVNYIFNGNTLTLSGTASSSTSVYVPLAKPITLVNGKQYTCSGNNGVMGDKNYISLYLSTTNSDAGLVSPAIISSLGTVQNATNTITYTGETVTCNYVRLYISSGVVTKNSANIQFEEGSSASAFEPFTEQTLPLNLPVENLFDGELELGYYDNTNGTKANANNLYRNKNIVSVKPNTTYTFSIDGVSQKYVLLYYQSNQDFISADTSLTTGTFTTPNNCYYINFRCFNADFTSDYATLKVQLEEGSKANSYTPYGTTPLEVCKKGNYEDEFFKASGKNQIGFVNLAETTLNGITYSIKNDVLSINGTASTFTTLEYLQFKLTKNTNKKLQFYLISGTYTASTIGVHFRNDSGNLQDEYINNTTTNLQKLFTISSENIANTTRIRLYVGGNAKFNNARIKIMLVDETTTNIPEYEPFGNKWYLKKNIGKKIFVNDDITKESTSYVNVTYAKLLKPTDFIGYGNNTFYPLVYTHAVATNSNDYYSANMRNKITPRPNNTTMWVGFEPNATVETMKSDLNNSVLYYPLAIPQYIPINDTLQTQLNNIRDKVLAYQNQTNISQVNNDLPFTIKASAIRDMSNIFELIEGTEL